MKNILITGIGLVGSQLVKKLYRKFDIKPVVIDQFFDWPYLDTIVNRSEFVPEQGSILDNNFLHHVLEHHEIEAIIHTAAVLPMRVGHDAHPGFFQVNTWGSANMMFSGRSAGIKKFILFSTNGVYQFRKYKVTAPVEEDFESGLSAHNSYGNSKATAETLLRELNSQGDFIGKIIRPGEIYGPVMSREGEDPIYWKGMIDAAINGEPYTLEGHPEHRLDWVYCKDVAEIAARLLMEKSTPNVEYHASFGKCMGIYDIKEGIDRLYPDNNIELVNCSEGGWNYPLSMKRAYEDLNFTPEYDLAKGLEDYANWYISLQQ